MSLPIITLLSPYNIERHKFQHKIMQHIQLIEFSFVIKHGAIEYLRDKSEKKKLHDNKNGKK